MSYQFSSDCDILRNRSGSTEDLVRMSLTGLNRPRMEGCTLRPSSPPRQLMEEMQQQLQMCKSELRKKDDLIKQVAGIDHNCSGHRTRFDITKLESHLSGDRVAYDNARSELMNSKAEMERINQALHETRHISDTKDFEINKLRLDVATYKENEERQMAIIDALKCRLADIEGETLCLEGTAGRSRVAIETLQRENTEWQHKYEALDDRLRSHLNDREDSDQMRVCWERKYQAIVSALKEVVHIDNEDLAGDAVLKKFSALIQEHAFDKAKLARFQEENENLRLEDKANRATIERLVGEVAREQRSATKYDNDFSTLMSERDEARRHKDELERDVILLKERLDHTQRQAEAARRDLDAHLSRASQADHEAREHSFHARNINNQLAQFRATLTALLHESTNSGEMSEEEVMAMIRHLKEKYANERARADLMENKIENMRAQFEEQYSLQNRSHSKVEQADAELAEMRERLRRAEGDVSANEIMRDGLRVDRERYLRFLEQLSGVLKMEQLSVDVGVDMMVDAVLGRSEQLVRLESDALAGRSSQIYTLQRKVKNLKEQIESKDLHLDLLRKKVTQLEERMNGKNHMDRERDNEAARSGKLDRLVEKYRSQVENARIEIKELKAQLLTTSDLRHGNLEQNGIIRELEGRVVELEAVNERQARKISHMKREVNVKDASGDESRRGADGAIRSLKDENRTLKLAMDDCRNREQELLDQRTVIGRMLGLDVNNLAIPAYELIERLRRLIESNHKTYIQSNSVENLLDTMDDAYRAGYETAGAIASPPRGRSPRRGEMRTTTHHRSRRVVRARSVSPVRRVDPRSY